MLGGGLNEVPGPANDAGTARIIVGTDLINVRMDRYVAGTRLIEVSTRGNEGSSQGNDGSSEGNEVSPRGNDVGTG